MRLSAEKPRRRAVEVNPAITDVLARWRAFAGDVYHEPGVRLVIADARRYLADTDERYDLIELALALTGNAHAAQPSGMEAHLYGAASLADALAGRLLRLWAGRIPPAAGTSLAPFN